jgi:TonB-dependent receptor
VVVTAGKLTDLDVSMPGDFTDLEEFVVQDAIRMGDGSEFGLLDLRAKAPALIDSIGADLMSRAGASDAASALKLVAGASVEGGKFAVIRGLPDRYVSSQLNGVRLPSADEDKRAVELDQFPAAIIESIRVSKTFTPDQQGDASGGAVDVRLKGIPEASIFEIKAETSYNTNVARRSDFLTYKGGGLDSLGFAGSDKDQQLDKLGRSWDGAVGVTEGDAPIDYKLGLTVGGKQVRDSGVKLGAFASVFYERDSSHFDDGINDSYWVDDLGEGLTPEQKQIEGAFDFKTALFDVTESSQSVQWGGLGTLGAEWDEGELGLTMLYTHIAEDKATLAEDTRGKAYFFPGHDPADPLSPGSDELDAAPWLRSQTLEYTERTTGTLMLNGRHDLSTGGVDLGPVSLDKPELSWTVATSFARLDQPDKRQFGSAWLPGDFMIYVPFKPAASFTLGNLQRIWKTIDETSNQYNAHLRWPLERSGGEEGYVKVGVFGDHVEREFRQESFSNFGGFSSYQGGWDEPWSDVFPLEDHPVTAAETDIDYDGTQRINAWYGMMDFPLSDELSLIGGARFESTSIDVVNIAEADAKWYPLGEVVPVDLTPGAADASFSQDDVLPSLGLVYEPTDKLTLRASWSRTVARQTFKELTPIIQQEFLGGPIFIGNPALEMSALENFDVRADYKPYEGGLLSLSAFKKNVKDPIEYVQQEVLFTFTTAENYPEGTLSGIELEARQSLANFWDSAEGLSLGGNATFISSEVTLPADEAAKFKDELGVPLSKRDMTFAPEHLYNIYLTYDLADLGTQLALFYTIKGDTLVAGAGESKDNFIPSVYAVEYGTLNFSLSQRLGDHLSLKLQAKNLTDPAIEEVYRSDFVPGGDVTKTSYTKGREFSIGLTYVP